MIQFDSNNSIILDKKSGDRERTQNALDYETDLSRQHLGNLRSDMIVPTTQGMYNASTVGTENALKDYGDIMGRYSSFLSDPSNKLTADQVTPTSINPYTIGYSRPDELGAALKGYGEFAKTGGFSPEAITDIRARGVSPIRSAYGNTMMELNRAKALGGPGGSSNYIAAASKAQRELPQQLSDATQAVNADVARMVQQGRLAGLGGLSATSQADVGFKQRAQLADQGATMQSRLANQDTGMRASLANQAANLSAGGTNIGSRLSGLGGMSSLYSATPGQASTFGNQVLNSTQNWLNAQQLQQQIANAKIQGQLSQSGIPTGFQSFLGNVGKVGDIATGFAGLF